MKRKSNLSEELYKMRKLMNFDSKEYKDNVTSYDKLMEEKLVEEYLINEQKSKIQNVIGVPWETTQLDINFYITFPKIEKLSREELNEILDKNPDLFKKAFKDAINGSLGERGAASISDENINKLSDYWMNKIKTDRDFNKDIRYTIAARKNEKDGVIKIEIDKLKAVPRKGISIQSKTKEIPPLPLYQDDSGKTKLTSNVDVKEISKYINNLNFSNIEGDQYYVNAKKGFFFLAPSDSEILVSTPKDSKSEEGKDLPPTREPMVVSLDVNFGDLFSPAQTQNITEDVIRQTILNQINQKIDEISEQAKGEEVKLESIKSANIVGSASNAWDGGRTWLPPTHKIGDSFGASASSGPSRSNAGPFADWASTANFNSAPVSNLFTGNNSSVQFRNAGYAWTRTQTVANAIRSINEQLKVKSNNINSEWRITDTGGALSTQGQFVTTTIEIEVSYEKIKPGGETTGVNSGTIYNFTYRLVPAIRKSKGNFSMDSLFMSGERVGRGGKYMSQGKAERRAKRRGRLGSSF